MKKRFPKFAQVSAQNKMINTADKFGNNGIKKQQGTTRVIYDTLMIDGSTKNFNFFENVQSRAFPFTNLTENKLNVGETMSIERAYFTLIALNTATGLITSITPLDSDIKTMLGEFTIEQANTVIAKQIPVLSMSPDFNKSADFDSDWSFDFDTLLTLQPLLEFKVPARFSNNLEVGKDNETAYIRLTLEGAGAIISPRGTF
ncbi:hypothetical protein DRH27_06160 [Candidatus Falkowbacteria bacterium]|nr:MAG: hypothetical protein DRH27_06160 [Candidatus Falkowbacteria bacterium]